MEHGISGAPVIDAFNNVIGMLTEGDLVRQQKPLTKPLFLMLFDGAIPVNLKKIQNEVEEMGATTVAQLMTQDVVSLHEYDPVSEAADYMIERTSTVCLSSTTKDSSSVLSPATILCVQRIWSTIAEQTL